MEEYFDTTNACFNDNFQAPSGQFENYRKSVVTTMAYLIGVSDERLACEDRFDVSQYEKLKESEPATIIRSLCRLRTQFLRNYKQIDDARKFNLRPLKEMTEYLEVEYIAYLRDKSIEVNVPNAISPTVNISHINQYILDNIDKVKPLIPDWIKFQYIKPLFLMPGGYSGHRGENLKTNYKKIYNTILLAGQNFGSQRRYYPYQMYIYWPYGFREGDGNILFNDHKFLKMLYAVNNDRFQATSYVVDATADTKENVYEFLSNAVNAAVFVDCENVDPYAFGATILNLDDNMLSKIKRIVLFDDVNTSTAWDYITNILAIPVIKKDVERVLNNKSLVDISMTAGVCEEHYKNDIESIILASSDSDFWGLIKQLPTARFLILNEFRKTSGAIIEQLDKNNIQHCYMNDFAQDSIQKFKFDVLYTGLLEKIKSFNQTGHFASLDVAELLQELFYEATITGAEDQVNKEKDAFFNKYLKNGFVLKPVSEDGKLVFKIELQKK